MFVLKTKRRKKILDFAKDVIKEHAGGKKVSITYIGLRPGERLHEILLTQEEARHTVEVADMFVILPESVEHLGVRPNLRRYPGMKKIRARSYSSG